jgi:hypothetical protein
MCNQTGILDGMKKEACLNGCLYANPEFVETNSSVIIFITGKAFKILKENGRGIDCSTALSRVALLQEELRINSEISPDLYLGVMPIFCQQARIFIGGEGSEPIEYALCMKRIGDGSLVYRLLSGGVYYPNHSVLIARKLAAFHASKLSGKLNEEDRRLVEEFGSVESFGKVVQKDFEMFATLKQDIIPEAITEEMYQEIKRYITGFMLAEHHLFEERRKKGFIVPIHGDFHSRNIFVEHGVVYAVDRSLKRQMRVGDIVKDLAYFAVDLEATGHGWQKKVFFDEYHRFVEDAYFDRLLPFLMCRQTFVAGLVSFSAGNIEYSRKCFEIAHSYAVCG